MMKTTILCVALAACHSAAMETSSTGDGGTRGGVLDAAPAGVAITPSSAPLSPGASLQFAATVDGVAASVTWSIAEADGGSVDASGKDTAPSSAGTYHVIATSMGEQGSATITVTLASDVVVDFANVHQHIDGFGAADIWGDPLTDAQADLFFSQTSGIGLSILRIGIDADGTFLSPLSDATKAAARGAIVWAAPWSPTASFKDTGNVNTGSLLPAHYDDWANSLVGAYNLAHASGVDLYAISVQNEPDYNTNGGYAMCLYTAAQMRDFIKVLGPKLAALNPRPKLMAVESSQWGNLWGGQDFLDAIANDADAVGALDIAATHQYDVYANVPVHALLPASRCGRPRSPPSMVRAVTSAMVSPSADGSMPRSSPATPARGTTGG